MGKRVTKAIARVIEPEEPDYDEDENEGYLEAHPQHQIYGTGDYFAVFEHTQFWVARRSPIMRTLEEAIALRDALIGLRRVKK